MINREDMLELTRRMTPERTSVGRIAGCYVDRDGDFEGSFNTNFLKLSLSERTQKLKIAKAVPFGKTNEELKDYVFSPEARRPGTMWQLLMGMKESGLKNDALMDTFYDVVMEHWKGSGPYAVLVFFGRYDVPLKASDKESLWDSEEVYEYMIGAVCPLKGEYEPGAPQWGFLFPAFVERSGDTGRIAVYEGMQNGRPGREMTETVTGVSASAAAKHLS